jgi:predicted metal-dependent RNase
MITLEQPNRRVRRQSSEEKQLTNEYWWAVMIRSDHGLHCCVMHELRSTMNERLEKKKYFRDQAQSDALSRHDFDASTVAHV